MNKAPAALLLLALLFASVASLCRQSDRKSVEPGSELGKAPPSAVSRQNPYARRPEAVLAGQKLFKWHCAGCHGADARGRAKAPNLHSLAVQKALPGALLWFLRNGNLKEGMPSWSRLPDQRLWQIITYLQSLE